MADTLGIATRAIDENSRSPQMDEGIARLYARDRGDLEGMQRAAELDVLPETWRDHFRKRPVRAA